MKRSENSEHMVTWSKSDKCFEMLARGLGFQTTADSAIASEFAGASVHRSEQQLCSISNVSCVYH